MGSNAAQWQKSNVVANVILDIHATSSKGNL
jgi:hypothetical protein